MFSGIERWRCGRKAREIEHEEGWDEGSRNLEAKRNRRILDEFVTNRITSEIHRYYMY
jgi:hypothetical protein